MPAKFLNRDRRPEQCIAVIGAGVVGVSVALALQRYGHHVTLLDREAACAGASSGNAGVIVNASCAPTAMPGALANALRMLGRPLSPLSIRPSYLPRLLPWLVRFAIESRVSRVEKNAKDLYALSKSSSASWQQLIGDSDLRHFLRSGGWLKVYESEKNFIATRYARELMDANEVSFELLNAADIRDLEPNLAPVFRHGIFVRDSLWISDPQKLIQGMADTFAAQGGVFRKFDVRAISIDGSRIALSDAVTSILADKVVIATGAYSKSLSQQMGDRIPLDTERGYHLALSPNDSRLLSRPVMNGDNSFVLVPMESGLRLTGQVEFAGLDGVPDFRMIRKLLPVATKMLPGIDSAEQSVWMGCRPSLPDSLPVIGAARRSTNVLYAFGHQHLGMTLGPATGLIIADLIAERDPGIDLTPYRPDRF